MADKIVVTGSSGFLGRHVMPVLIQHYGEENVCGLSGKDYDLMDPVQVRRMFAERSPDILVHLAAYSAGLGANKQYPADFYYRNNLLTTYAFHEAAMHKIKKLVFTMGGCAYPSKATSPIDESQMWNGFVQIENAGYAMSKKMGIVASMTYRQQYGLNSIVLIPGNLYGEYDNYRQTESRVIPAMIRRYFEAKLAKAPEIVMWGSGEPVRDFVYVRDVARLFPYFIEKYDVSEPVNISTGTRTSIRELAELMSDLMEYEGKIVWDKTKPNGQMDKIFSVQRLHSLGLDCPTSLRDGLRRTIDWFSKHYQHQSDGIRL